ALCHRRDLLWRDSPSGRVDDDLFLSIGDCQAAVFIDETDVAGVKPSLGIDRLRRRFRVVPVTLHDVRSACADLTVFRDLHFDAGDQRTDGAEAAFVETIQSDDG